MDFRQEQRVFELEKIMAGLIGRDSGQTLPKPVELPFDFEFKLN